MLDAGLYKTHTKLDFIRWFHEMGVPIVAGTDAITTFGDYAIGLELLHRAGLSMMEVIVSATNLAAKAIGWQERVGMVKPGMLADLIYVDGAPLTDIKALDHVVSVVMGGKPVVDKKTE